MTSLAKMMLHVVPHVSLTEKMAPFGAQYADECVCLCVCVGVHGFASRRGRVTLYVGGGGCCSVPVCWD